MFIQHYVETTISNQGSYYRTLGYDVPKQRQKLIVYIDDLAKNSNRKVTCKCDKCLMSFRRQFQILMKSGEHYCNSCSRKMIYKNLSSEKRENLVAHMRLRTGSKHHNWNSRKSEFSKYQGRVIYLSRKQPLHTLENFDKPTGYNGTNGVYQLDHMLSISEAFKLGLTPETVAHICNLRYIPWEENIRKFNKSSLTSEELMRRINEYDINNYNIQHSRTVNAI